MFTPQITLGSFEVQHSCFRAGLLHVISMLFLLFFFEGEPRFSLFEI